MYRPCGLANQHNFTLQRRSKDIGYSDWDQWGLKHRYTLTGGTGADAENGSGLDYCIKPSPNYTPIEGMEREVIEAVQGWMASPGHRRNLLDPAHTMLNVGIAHDRNDQHFSSDYVNYPKPGIDPGGVLLLEGEVSGATLRAIPSTP